MFLPLNMQVLIAQPVHGYKRTFLALDTKLKKLPSRPSYPSDLFAHHKTVNTIQSNVRFDKNRVRTERRVSINVRRPPLSGRHFLAAEKPLTKFAIPLGEGAPTAPRAPTRKTRVWKAPPPAEARARQPLG